MGIDLIDIASYRQMIGRAGRTNLDTSGESYLMINGDYRTERQHGLHLVTGELEPLQSNLQHGYGGGIHKLLLELIYCGRIRTIDDIALFVSWTLMAIQYPSEDVNDWTKTAVEFLVTRRFIRVVSQSIPEEALVGTTDVVDGGAAPSVATANITLLPTVMYLPTAMGRATVKSGIPPQDALELLVSLEQARV